MTRPTSRPSPVGPELCRIVQARPGIHFRDLGRVAGLASAGQLRHHLDRLRRQGRLLEFADGRYRRYFVPNGPDAHLRARICRFTRPIPRSIGRALLEGPMNRTALRRALDLADSTLGYHLARMVAAGDLEKRRGVNCCNYLLVDTELVRQVVQMHEAATQGGLEVVQAGPVAAAAQQTPTTSKDEALPAAFEASFGAASQPEDQATASPQSTAPAADPFALQGADTTVGPAAESAAEPALDSPDVVDADAEAPASSDARPEAEPVVQGLRSLAAGHAGTTGLLRPVAHESFVIGSDLA